jgi:hypothetical protein
MRKPHFGSVHCAIAGALDHGEDVVVVGIEDDALKSSLSSTGQKCQFLASEPLQSFWRIRTLNVSRLVMAGELDSVCLGNVPPCHALGRWAKEKVTAETDAVRIESSSARATSRTSEQ